MKNSDFVDRYNESLEAMKNELRKYSFYKEAVVEREFTFLALYVTQIVFQGFERDFPEEFIELFERHKNTELSFNMYALMTSNIYTDVTDHPDHLRLFYYPKSLRKELINTIREDSTSLTLLAFLDLVISPNLVANYAKAEARPISEPTAMAFVQGSLMNCLDIYSRFIDILFDR